MNILFFCHADFTCNSMGHIAGFAEGLKALGHASAAAIPGDDPSSARSLGDEPPFRPLLFSDTWQNPEKLFPDGRSPDIIHAWTPRDHVRRAVERCLQDLPAARLFVHLEDNEEHLTATFAGQDIARLRELPDEELDALLPVHLSHPRRYREFLERAEGVTGIIRALSDFAPPGKPFLELWPGIDFRRYHPAPPDAALRVSLGLRTEEKILCYPGNSHFANRAELQSLYDAVRQLNQGGRPCRLVRAGVDTVDFPQRFTAEELADFVRHLGPVEQARVPDLLRLADVLVQPGANDNFNRYRLPSKVPEFLAVGRPVVMPRSNVGMHVRPGEEALLLEDTRPESIVAQCQRVFDDSTLADRLAAGGAAFAHCRFDRFENARRLEDFYRRDRPFRRTFWERWFGARR